jgi:hypothetical protein
MGGGYGAGNPSVGGAARAANGQTPRGNGGFGGGVPGSRMDQGAGDGSGRVTLGSLLRSRGRYEPSSSSAEPKEVQTSDGS